MTLRLLYKSLSMDIFTTDCFLTLAIILNKFLDKSSHYRENAVTFYTDRTKMTSDGPSGIEVFSPELNLWLLYRLPAETSIYMTEAWAILQAINAIVDCNCTKAVIFSDSKSVLDSLASLLPNNKNYLIYRIKSRLLNVQGEEREVILFWVPAHKSIPGNETADFLVKRIAASSYRP